MFFPIGDDQVKGGSFPLFSYGFIVLNVIVFFMQLSSESNLMEYASVPSEIVGGNNFHTVITSMFLHGGWMHLLWNMLFLWIFADNIEATIGNFNFLLFYLLGGVAATLAHIYFNSQSSIPMVGASGAISAVLGAYIVMFPRSRVKTFFLFFFINIPAFVFLGIWIVQQTVNGISSVGEQNVGGGGVAWWAHIGGFLFGAIVGFYLKNAYPDRSLHQ